MSFISRFHELENKVSLFLSRRLKSFKERKSSLKTISTNPCLSSTLKNNPKRQSWWNHNYPLSNIGSRQSTTPNTDKVSQTNNNKSSNQSPTSQPQSPPTKSPSLYKSTPTLSSPTEPSIADSSSTTECQSNFKANNPNGYPNKPKWMDYLRVC